MKNTIKLFLSRKMEYFYQVSLVGVTFPRGLETWLWNLQFVLVVVRHWHSRTMKNYVNVRAE